MAALHMIIGPMGSGKTTELIRDMNRYRLGKKKIVFVKPERDTRQRGIVATRTSSGVGIQEPAIEVMHLVDLPDMVADVFGIDEGQFFDDLRAGCELLLSKGKRVIVAGLSGDSRRRDFRPISDLLPIADSITFLRAVCIKCGADAPFTAHRGRLSDQIKVGDLDEYPPLCRACYDSFDRE